MEIILASNSQNRKDILNMAHIKYKAIPSDIIEKSNYVRPYEYVSDLSRKKAESINEKGLIIAADTVILCENKILEKPDNYEHAMKMLKQLSGKTSKAYTGVTIIDSIYKKTFYELTEFTFSEITDEEISWYLKNGSNIYNRCGGFSVNNEAGLFIESINGDFYNILGLPLNRIYKELKLMGYNINELINF